MESINPLNTDAEDAIIGLIVIYGLEAFDGAQPLLVREDFYKQVNRDVWELCERFSEDRKQIDILTLESASKSKLVTKQYLLGVTNTYPDQANFQEYVNIVKRKSMARAKMAQCKETMNRLSAGEDPEEVISQDLFFDSEVLEKKNVDHVRSIGKGILQVVEDIEERFNNKIVITGLRTGFTYLDFVLGGLRKDSINVLAALPGCGKTTFALNVAKNAVNYGGVYIGSLEMSFEQLQGKMLANDAGINSMAVDNTRLLKPDDIDKLTNSAANLSTKNIFIDDSVRIKASQIAARLRRLKAKNDIKLAIIDYLQLVEAEKETNSRHNEITRTLAIFKKVTRELQIPIFLISQLNRNYANRSSKKPMMSDLKESGSIEQDAATVMFLYQEEDNPENVVPVKMFIAKNRFGPSQYDLDFTFNKPKSQFSLLEKTYDEKTL